MNKIIFCLASLVSVSVFAQPNFSACMMTYSYCGKSKTCQAHYSCLKQHHKLLNDLVYQAMTAIDTDAMKECRTQREVVEEEIFAHATTIECIDTPQGPDFGG